MKTQTIVILVIAAVVGLVGLLVVGLAVLGFVFWSVAQSGAPMKVPMEVYEVRPSDSAVEMVPEELTPATAVPMSPETAGSEAIGVGPAAGRRDFGTMVFQRIREPREGAFTMLIPKGWLVEGGIMRVDPSAAGGAAQSIEAKIDMTIKRDAAGTVLFRRLPDFRYCDTRGMPTAAMFPPGSNYNGMQVMPKMSAADFLGRMVFPNTHPQARNARVVDQRPLPQLAQDYQRRVAALPIGGSFSFDAAVVTVEYDEGGTAYREVLVSLIQDYGQLGAGMWENKETGFFRAPVAEFDKWAAVANVMTNSIDVNRQWLAGELRGQITRAGIAIDTQQELQRIEQEIVTHKQRTNAEIHNDMFLTLTGQEEYVNPFTKQTERDTNQWRYRWVNPAGEVVVTNRDEYDPNHDTATNRSDFQRTPVRKRFPQ